MFHNTPLQKYGHNVEIASYFYDQKMEIRHDENLEINTLEASAMPQKIPGFGAEPHFRSDHPEHSQAPKYDHNGQETR